MNARMLLTNFLLVATFGCSEAQPSDSRVIADMKLNKDGLIDAYCVKGKKGEQYWHPNDRAWYWDRGVVVKRKANIQGAPDAVVIVQGLARYHTDGQNYNFHKFLTTDNRYEGIPAPSKEKLADYVKGQIKEVFIGRAHNITEVSAINMDQDSPWVWHTAASFTAKFKIAYREIVSYTDVAEREGLFEIRFYRKDVNSPIHGLLSTEVSREDKGRTKYSDDEIKQMRSLLNR